MHPPRKLEDVRARQTLQHARNYDDLGMGQLRDVIGNSLFPEPRPDWIYPGEHIIERRLLDHLLSRDVPRTKHMLAGLAKYRLTLGQARQDDLLGLIKDGLS